MYLLALLFLGTCPFLRLPLDTPVLQVEGLGDSVQTDSMWFMDDGNAVFPVESRVWFLRHSSDIPYYFSLTKKLSPLRLETSHFYIYPDGSILFFHPGYRHSFLYKTKRNIKDLRMISLPSSWSRSSRNDSMLHSVGDGRFLSYSPSGLTMLDENGRIIWHTPIFLNSKRYRVRLGNGLYKPIDSIVVYRNNDGRIHWYSWKDGSLQGVATLGCRLVYVGSFIDGDTLAVCRNGASQYMFAILSRYGKQTVYTVKLDNPIENIYIGAHDNIIMISQKDDSYILTSHAKTDFKKLWCYKFSSKKHVNIADIDRRGEIVLYIPPSYLVALSGDGVPVWHWKAPKNENIVSTTVYLTQGRILVHTRNYEELESRRYILRLPPSGEVAK